MPVPVLGLGTSGNDDPEQCAETARTALELGYRHVDTAQMYDNETAVGRAVAEMAVPREDVFVATKVHPSNLAHDDELADRGLTRHVGVSNVTPELLREADRLLDAPLVANQVEVHPLLPPRRELVEACERVGADIVAYTPSCRGEALDVPEIEAVASERGVSPARVILAWLREKGCRPIPKATGEAHLRDSYAALDLSLDDAETARIDPIDRRYRRFDPDGAPCS